MLWPRPVQWLPRELSRLVMPPVCAGCGGAPNASLPAREPFGQPAQRIPYCNTCRRDRRRQAAAARTVGALGLGLGVACGLLLPLAWPQASLGTQLLAAGLCCLLPLFFSGLSRHGPYRASRVWGVAFLGTVAEQPQFAASLAQANATRARRLWLPPLVYRPAWWALPVLALGLAAASHVWHHPRLRVVNTSAGWLWLEVDGLPRLAVPEAPLGGVSWASVRLPRGGRRLVARDERGQLVADTWAELVGGREHLFAPGAVQHCFWLETTGYGKDATSRIVPLASASRFFSLAGDVDSWFADGPEPPPSDRRSSGGTLTALHQSPCASAPITVRSAVSAVGP
jgi:hypothetical protein